MSLVATIYQNQHDGEFTKNACGPHAEARPIATSITTIIIWDDPEMQSLEKTARWGSTMLGGPAREGLALLAGLLLCGATVVHAINRPLQYRQRRHAIRPPLQRNS